MKTEAFYRPGGLFLEQASPPSSQRWPLDGDVLAIGRDPASAICLNDTSISWHHADLVRRGLSWVIVDAHSTNGTSVNDRRVGESPVRAPDRIRLGRVELVVAEPGFGRGEGQTETIGPGAGRPAPAPGDIRIREQHGQMINNAESIYYIQQRENFLQQVAGTKTKARWLVWTGFVAFLIGFALFLYADLGFLKEINNAFQTNQEPASFSPFGREVGGVPVALIGAALNAAGTIAIIVGIVLHIVAASRRKRADRDFPVPAPQPGGRPYGG